MCTDANAVQHNERGKKSLFKGQENDRRKCIENTHFIAHFTLQRNNKKCTKKHFDIC